MTEKQKAKILFPSWMTKKQIELLRHAEKGELPAEIEKRLKKAMNPKTPYERPKFYVGDEVIEFTDIPENRFASFLQKEFGDFGLILWARGMEYANFPKAEAEKNCLYIMTHSFTARRAGQKTA
jgi:hypothetical protein